MVLDVTGDRLEVEPVSYIADKSIAYSSVYKFVAWVAKRDAMAKFEHCRETYTADHHP